MTTLTLSHLIDTCKPMTSILIYGVLGKRVDMSRLKLERASDIDNENLSKHPLQSWCNTFNDL